MLIETYYQFTIQVTNFLKPIDPCLSFFLILFIICTLKLALYLFFFLQNKLKSLWNKEEKKSINYSIFIQDLLSYRLFYSLFGFPVGSDGKESTHNAGDPGFIYLVRSLGWEDPFEKEMATHSYIFAWRVPLPEEPGRLQFMGSQSVRHDLATNIFTLTLSFIT